MAAKVGGVGAGGAARSHMSALERIEAVQSGDGSGIKSPYDDAYAMQVIACAANESMASGRPEKP